MVITGYFYNSNQENYCKSKSTNGILEEFGRSNTDLDMNAAYLS